MKRGLLLIVLGLCSLLFIASYTSPIKESKNTPDSGWDYDYDRSDNDRSSRGSYDGGSDNSYYYNDITGRDRSSSREGKDWIKEKCSDKGFWCEFRETLKIILSCLLQFLLVFPVFMILYLHVIFVEWLSRERKIRKKIKEIKKEIKEKAMSNKEISSYGLNRGSILKKAYRIYKETQIAWMNFDYIKLRSLLSDELYNNYAILLDALKLKDQTNIMRHIRKRYINIVDIKCEDGLYTIKVHLLVTQKDYVINNIRKKKVEIKKLFKHPIKHLKDVFAPARGNRRTHPVYYELTYTMTKEINNICPNCGNKLGDDESTVCDRCGSIVINKTHDLTLTTKRIKKQ